MSNYFDAQPGSTAPTGTALCFACVPNTLQVQQLLAMGDAVNSTREFLSKKGERFNKTVG